VYNRTDAASLDLTTAVLAGLISGDNLTISSANGAFTNVNAGAGRTVAISGLTLGGTDVGNYQLASTTTTTTADITKATITAIGNLSGVNRTYNATTAAQLNTGSATFTGLISGDGLSVGSYNASFADKNAETGKAITINSLSLGGISAGNYQLGSGAIPTTLTADVTKASITAISGITANNKVYNDSTCRHPQHRWCQLCRNRPRRRAERCHSDGCIQ